KNPHRAKGLCSTHYNAQLRASGYTPPTHGPCAIDGCDTPSVAKGLCGLHYSRVRKHGDANTVLPRGRKFGAEAPSRPCAAEGCTRKVQTATYCPPHAARVRTHGDPLAHLPIQDGPRDRSRLPSTITLDGDDDSGLSIVLVCATCGGYTFGPVATRQAAVALAHAHCDERHAGGWE